MDVMSRGMLAQELIDHSQIITRSREHIRQPLQPRLREKPNVSLPTVVQKFLFSLVYLAACTRRFCNNSKKQNRETGNTNALSTAELEEALVTLVTLAQQASFAEDVCSIHTSGQVKTSSKLKRFVRSSLMEFCVLETQQRRHMVRSNSTQ